MSRLFAQEYQVLDEAISAVEKEHPKLAEVFYAVSILDPLWVSRYDSLRQLFSATVMLAESVLDGDL